MIKKFLILLFIIAAFHSPAAAQISAPAADSSQTSFFSGPGRHLLLFKPGQLPDSMTYGEFVKLQRYLNWQRILGAAIVPGYIHFYAGHKRAAWIIAGGRATGALLSAYALIDQARHVDNFSLNFFSVADSLSSLKKRSERNMILFWAGMILNFAGYAFDWGHGDFIIDSERNAVLYKYGSGRSAKPLSGVWLDSHRKILGAVLRIPM